MRKTIIMALAGACLCGAISVGNAGNRQHNTHYSACAYVWNGFARVFSRQMLAPIKSGQQEMISQSQASLDKRTR